jgi:hypothetical protein
MHNAPSVSYPAGRCASAGAAIAVIWSAGAAGIVLWSMQARVAPAALAAACLMLLAGGALAWRAWLRSPVGTLSWDGQGWSWVADTGAQAGTPELALDGQRVLLLRWQGAGRAQWLWLERSALPARWDDLRRAVYSRARPEALPGAQPPGEAKP